MDNLTYALSAQFIVRALSRSLFLVLTPEGEIVPSLLPCVTDLQYVGIDKAAINLLTMALGPSEKKVSLALNKSRNEGQILSGDWSQMLYVENVISKKPSGSFG